MRKTLNKPVKFGLDLSQLPPLTAAQKAELQALDAMPDSAIDTTDIAPLTADFWKQATRSPLYKPVKQSTTVRVDADVLVWLKSKGKGYHTRINAILREAMLHEVHKV